VKINGGGVKSGKMATISKSAGIGISENINNRNENNRNEINGVKAAAGENISIISGKMACWRKCG
jgi:hypothetical protein